MSKLQKPRELNTTQHKTAHDRQTKHYKHTASTDNTLQKNAANTEDDKHCFQRTQFGDSLVIRGTIKLVS